MTSVGRTLCMMSRQLSANEQIARFLLHRIPRAHLLPALLAELNIEKLWQDTYNDWYTVQKILFNRCRDTNPGNTWLDHSSTAEYQYTLAELERQAYCRRQWIWISIANVAL